MLPSSIGSSLGRLRTLLLQDPAIPDEEVACVSVEDHYFSLLEAEDLGLWLGLAGRRPDSLPGLDLHGSRLFDRLFGGGSHDALSENGELAAGSLLSAISSHPLARGGPLNCGGCGWGWFGSSGYDTVEYQLDRFQTGGLLHLSCAALDAPRTPGIL